MNAGAAGEGVYGICKEANGLQVYGWMVMTGDRSTVRRARRGQDDRAMAGGMTGGSLTGIRWRARKEAYGSGSSRTG